MHNSNGKHVSIWTVDKSALTLSRSGGGGGGGGRSGAGASGGANDKAARLQKAIDTLKRDAASLSRLRHPCVLEVAEPMEETRSVEARLLSVPLRARRIAGN